MLVEFTVGNFLSFKAPVTISLEAAGISEFPENLFQVGKRKLLKRAVVYGANSSGKSNLLDALAVMVEFVTESAKMSSSDEINVTPFLLNTETEKAPSFFEVLFLLGEYRYRYGFEVDKTAVRTEWLYRAKAKTEKLLFVRDGDEIQVMDIFPEGVDLEEKTRANALFLSVVDQFNGKIAKSIHAWFDSLKVISGLSHDNYRMLTFNLLQDNTINPLVTNFLKNLDLGFRAFQLVKQPFNPDLLPVGLPPRLIREITADLSGKTMVTIETLHKIYNDSGEEIGQKEFNLRTQESAGTNKLFDLIGPVFYTLINGGVIVVDELGAKMHPLITRSLILLFSSVEFNPKNAQLIFATHDTNLLTYGEFRRDQIYFIEKDIYGASNLYSLIEYKEDEGGTIRKERPFQRDYMQGRYGGIPQIGDFSNLRSTWQEKQKLTTQS